MTTHDERLREEAVGLALFAQAIARVTAGDSVGAAATMAKALTNCEPGSHAWWLPVEPMLGVAAQPEIWAPVLAQLRSRAS